MTSLELEIHQRSVCFRADIARRAALVPKPENRTYYIPNTPFGVKKIRPRTMRPRTIQVERPVDPDWLHCMWFYDLIVYHDPVTNGPLRIETIQRAVCRRFNMTMVDLISERRTAPHVWARQIAMYLAKVLTPRSLPEIGRRFGNRDHTTVIHAVRKIEGLLTTDPGRCDLLADVSALHAELSL